MFSNSIGVIGAASYDKYYTAEDGSVLRTHQNLAAHETFQFHHILPWHLQNGIYEGKTGKILGKVY